MVSINGFTERWRYKVPTFCKHYPHLRHKGNYIILCYSEKIPCFTSYNFISECRCTPPLAILSLNMNIWINLSAYLKVASIFTIIFCLIGRGNFNPYAVSRGRSYNSTIFYVFWSRQWKIYVRNNLVHCGMGQRWWLELWKI